MNLRIFPPDALPEGTIVLPWSKSVSNRALIINALSPNPVVAPEVADCSDTRVMQQALSACGTDEIDVADCGTAMRFLTAFFAVSSGRSVTLTGTPRMLQRPVRPLVDTLRRLGADIEYLGAEGYPPLKINGTHLEGGEAEIDATVSSQYISALLMIAPKMSRGLQLTLRGEAASLPYIDLTLSMMSQAGIPCDRSGEKIVVGSGVYDASSLRPQRDWSAASFWYEITAVTSGFITLEGLDSHSMQPDRRSMELFGQLGVASEESEENAGIDLCGDPEVAPRLVADLSATPDMAPALAVCCALIGVPFRLTGLESLRIKECDRLEAIAAELMKIGVECQTPGGHTLLWEGRRHPVFELPVFDSHGDHRIAMALAPAAAYIPGIVVRDAEVVGKSYPEFWAHLRSVGFTLADADAPVPEGEEEAG